MKVELIKVRKDKAKREWKDYIEILKTRKEKYLKEMKQLYFHAKKGKRILDIYKVFKVTGLDNKDQPRLAISPVSQKEIFFKKYNSGAGTFKTDQWDWSVKNVSLPDGTFKFKLKNANGYLMNETISTNVPIVPARILKSLPFKNLKDFYILWETDNWRVGKDPILLKKITGNLFIVFAVWNLTPLEKSLIK